MKTVKAIHLFMANRRMKGLAVSTLKQYSQQLSYMLNFSNKLITDPAKLEAIILSIKGTQETRHSYYRTYRTFYNFMDRRCHIPNPMKSVEPPRLKPKVMPTLETNELSLLSLFTRDARDNALITLLLDTGIRTSEATSLQQDNIKEGYIIVRGKVGQRTVPISPVVRSALLNLPKYEDGYVFHGHSGKLTRSGAYRVVRQALERVGITGSKLGAHRLRHTFGRHWLTLGGDLRSLQIIMGHSNIRTTEKYASLVFDDVAVKHKQCSPVQLLSGSSVTYARLGMV